jgi:hypothetical protein
MAVRKKRWTPEEWAWGWTRQGEPSRVVARLGQLGQRSSGTPRLVLVALARHAHWSDFTCYPSSEALAKTCGVHRDAVQRAFNILEELELLQRFPCFVSNERRPSQFLLNCHDLDGCAWTSARQVYEARLLAGQIVRRGEVLQTVRRFTTTPLQQPSSGDRSLTMAERYAQRALINEAAAPAAPGAKSPGRKFRRPTLPPSVTPQAI